MKARPDRAIGGAPCVPVARIVAFFRAMHFCAWQLPAGFLIDNLRHIQMTGERAAGNINI
ncbi:MAG: hypothetical protein LBJ65_27145 [Burkholderia sp.]|uniref:hypothetical protein n=1 Tax=Burkholderia sp. TaxID=36773 RepID=UPI00281945C0|nr:hypothetical protein [Burkholderia sp.]MDR0245291.1 hypothetical protein [Burkholderia sp.]